MELLKRWFPKLILLHSSCQDWPMALMVEDQNGEWIRFKDYLDLGLTYAPSFGIGIRHTTQIENYSSVIMVPYMYGDWIPYKSYLILKEKSNHESF